MSVFIDHGVDGALSVASVIVMELCTVTRRYLDIEAAIAGLLAVFYSLCFQELSSHYVNSSDL